jgi:hypothetical protein
MRERDGQLTEVTGQLALATLQNRDHQLSLGNLEIPVPTSQISKDERSREVMFRALVYIFPFFDDGP